MSRMKSRCQCSGACRRPNVDWWAGLLLSQPSLLNSGEAAGIIDEEIKSMSEEPLITEEAREFVGKEIHTISFQVIKEDIKKVEEFLELGVNLK